MMLDRLPFKLITTAKTEDEWLEVRRSGLTGSDFAGLLSSSPWVSPATIYADKLGLLPPKPPTEPMYWGTALEDAIADRYQEETGIRLQCLPKWSVAQHPEFPWWLGTPDRIAGDVPDLGVEIKTARTDRGWGEPGSDDIPDHYLIQSASYMALTGRPRWDVAVLIGGQDFRIYHLQESPALTKAMQEAGERFWEAHVLAQVPPPMDGTEECTAMLQKLYPRSARPLIPADPASFAAARMLAQARAELERAEKQKALWENHLKDVIKDAEGLDFGAAGKITWKHNKDSQRTDWEAVAIKLWSDFVLTSDCPRPASLAAMATQFTTTKAGARPFIFKVDGEQL